AGCFGCLRQGAERPLTILVATSGDTGGAVAAAFHQRPGVEVAVLFPKGLVSPTQERQLTCWGGNDRPVSVRGTRDDCQRLVKEAFRDAAHARRAQLSSANSINLGRLLPQMVYYAAASLATWRAHRERASFIVPSGNLGNALACLWVRRIGLPIGEVVLAHNANRTVPDFLASGEWRPRPSVATLASAMDVGDPSNMERLRALHAGIEELRAAVSAVSVSDDEIRARIVAGYRQFGRSGARTPRPLPRPGRGCRPRHAGSVAGCWLRPPTRPSSARSWSRSSGARSRCRRRSRSCSRVPRSVLKSTPTDARCARSSSRGNDVDQLSQLPPIVWVLIAA